MRAIPLITLLAILVTPALAFAEIQTFTALHTYILGDHDSKDDARQLCLLEAKHKIIEQAGIYIESASEVKNFDLTKDKVTSFAAAVMQVKDTKENFGFENGHMSLTLKLTAQVDLSEVRKQLAARQLDACVREDVSVQNERLKRLEAQLDAMQRQQVGQSSEHAPVSPPIEFSTKEMQPLRIQADQGNAKAQTTLAMLYSLGRVVPQDYAMARQWGEKAATQGDAAGQTFLEALYYKGQSVPLDHATARQWWEKAAAQGNMFAQYSLGRMYVMGQGVPSDFEKARQWFEKAAAQDHADAQYTFGRLCEEGEGVH